MSAFLGRDETLTFEDLEYFVEIFLGHILGKSHVVYGKLALGRERGDGPEAVVGFLRYAHTLPDIYPFPI